MYSTNILKDTDPNLEAIAAKRLAHKRLTVDEGIYLFENASLPWLLYLF
jgi:hypothetical protein